MWPPRISRDHPKTFERDVRSRLPSLVQLMPTPINTADEAETVAINYIQQKSGKTAQDTSIVRVAFDGTFFSVYGSFKQDEILFQFGVKIDKNGNVVGWYANQPPSF